MFRKLSFQILHMKRKQAHYLVVANNSNIMSLFDSADEACGFARRHGLRNIELRLLESMGYFHQVAVARMQANQLCTAKKLYDKITDDEGRMTVLAEACWKHMLLGIRIADAKVSEKVEALLSLISGRSSPLPENFHYFHDTSVEGREVRLLIASAMSSCRATLTLPRSIHFMPFIPRIKSGSRSCLLRSVLLITTRKLYFVLKLCGTRLQQPVLLNHSLQFFRGKRSFCNTVAYQDVFAWIPIRNTAHRSSGY